MDIREEIKLVGIQEGMQKGLREGMQSRSLTGENAILAGLSLSMKKNFALVRHCALIEGHECKFCNRAILFFIFVKQALRFNCEA